MRVIAAAKLARSAIKPETGQIEDETQEFISGYSDSLDGDASIAYIEEDYELGDGEDNDTTTYLVEYVNEDTDGNDGDEIIAEQAAGDTSTTEYTEVLDDMADGSDDAGDLYNCNLCGMTFGNVKEHVDKYHSNEDVVIEMDDYEGSEEPLAGTEFEGDAESCVLPADDADYRSAIIQSEDENSLVELASDMEGSEMYEIDAPTDADEGNQPLTTVRSTITIWYIDTSVDAHCI